MRQNLAALRLYRRALRAALRCPDPSQGKMLRDYARIRAGRERGQTDAVAVKRLIEDALEEIERMEYFLAARAGTTTEPNRELASFVCECGSPFTAGAKFCSQCGRPRPATGSR